MVASTTQLLLAIMLFTGFLFGIWGFICLLFRRHSRLAGLCMIVGGIAFFSHATTQMDAEVRALGFASLSDYNEARQAGVADASVWRSKRNTIRAQQAAAEAAQELAAQSKAAAAAGFSSVAAYEQARSAGFTSKAAYDTHLAAEAFFKPPPDQSAVLDAVAGARVAYHGAANELAKGAARAQRKRAICKHVRQLRARNWTGTITQLTTNTKGKGIATVKIAEDAYVKTWNNAFSDIAHGTLIDADSAVFRKLAMLTEGARVKFSGRFFASNDDCLREASLTLRGSVLEPEFIIRFTDIQTR